MKKELLLGLGVIGLTLGAVRGCNFLLNNRHINKDHAAPYHETISYATGLAGHVEFTRYAHGPHDVKIYPGLGHRFFDSKLYQDLDGDGDVDRIRENGSELVLNRLNKLLIRDSDYDYARHKEEFDEADSVLKDLIRRYPRGW